MQRDNGDRVYSFGGCGHDNRGLLLLAAIVGAPLCCESVGARESISEAQIAERIIQASRSAYYATGHPCACPYDRARNGSSCGGRSAYSRPGGAEPKCYPQDVTKTDIEQYRRTNP
jgi:hypothetical protein